MDCALKQFVGGAYWGKENKTSLLDLCHHTRTVAEDVCVQARIQVSMFVISRLGSKATLIPQHKYVETERRNFTYCNRWYNIVGILVAG